MPDFTFPPWIHAPESVAKSYATGVELGANIQNQRAQLQEKEMSDALWANIAQQRQNQEQAYRQAQLGQEAQRMQQDEQLNQIKIQEAQRKFAAQQQYQQFVQGGGDPLQGIMQFFPGTDESMTGYGQLARQMQLSKLGGAQPEVVNYGGEQFLKHRNEQGGWSYTPLHQGQDSLGRFLKEESVRELYKNAQEAQKNLNEQFPASYMQSLLVKPPGELTDAEKNIMKRYRDAQQSMQHDAWAIRQREHQLSPQDFPDPGPDPSAPVSAPQSGGGGGGGGMPAYDRSKIIPTPTPIASQPMPSSMGSGVFSQPTPTLPNLSGLADVSEKAFNAISQAPGQLEKILDFLSRSRFKLPGSDAGGVQIPDYLSTDSPPAFKPEFIPTDSGAATNYNR